MLKLLPVLSMLCFVFSPIPGRAMDILSPTDDGIVIGSTARFIIECGSTPDVSATIGDQSYGIVWTKELYGNRWVGDLELPHKGEHTVVLEGTCGNNNTSGDVRFDNTIESSVEIADLVIARFFSMNKVEGLDWNWGPAIFLYPLLKIAPKSAHGDQYLDYIKKYHQHHLDKGLPKIQWADHCPPALSAFDLAALHQDDFAWSSVEKVMTWIKTAKRNNVGSIDHLGYNNIKSLWFPDSIWVDSLVMWALITVKYALYTNDDELLAFGVDQPFIFEDKLHNPVTELFYHAWNLEKNQPYPADNAHWLRGNGWVLVAVAEILSLIGDEHERYEDLAAIFVDLAEATLPHRQPSGYWDTVIDDPGYAYEESSGSALVATAYAKGTQLGLLPAKYRQYARDTFAAITARMKRRSTGFTMEEISMGTNPENKLGYKLILKDRNISYGVGAFLLLADALSDDSFDADDQQDGDAGPDNETDTATDSVTDVEEDTDSDDNTDADSDSEDRDDGSPDADTDEASSSSSCQCTLTNGQKTSLIAVIGHFF